MPYGPVTPLGRQLRSVLSNLRNGPTTTIAPRARHASNIKTNAPDHTAEGRMSADNAPKRSKGSEEKYLLNKRRDISRATRLKRRTRRDWITEALTETGNNDLVPTRPRGKTDLSHTSTRKSDWNSSRTENEIRHKKDYRPRIKKVKDLNVGRIIAVHIFREGSEGEWDEGGLYDNPAPAFEMPLEEENYLRAKGYGINDVRAWAKIATTQDSIEAARLLSDRLEGPRGEREPAYLIQGFLRRPRVSAEALRIMTQAIHVYLDRSHSARADNEHMGLDAAFMMFFRLLRHARQVMPRAISDITDLFLVNLPAITADDRSTELPRLTHILNNAMKHLSLPSAVEPYKDVEHMEAGIVKVLRYMAEHDPPLQLNREGYQAVIRVQLAQEKTLNEREWAELKALSWPPWKVDRTGMDALITPEHGLSRASHTLNRMKAAGYAPTSWEDAAKIFSGWDVDGTPTIQTRTWMSLRINHDQLDAAVWMARIISTRTLQEAWAAFLTYEETKLPLTKPVIEAILEKLLLEDKRQRKPFKQSREQHLVLPGDVPEITPLPPSTHLYTYTRTPPPTVEFFLEWLKEKDVELSVHALAIVIRKSHSFQDGVKCIRYAESRWPPIAGLLSMDPSVKPKEIPRAIIEALIEFLCRFSNVPMWKFTKGRLRIHRQTRRTSPQLKLSINDKPLNFASPLVRVFALAKTQRITSARTWYSIFYTLTRDITIESMRTVFSRTSENNSTKMPAASLGPITAYQILDLAAAEMKGLLVDSDLKAVHSICTVTGNASWAAWKILKQKPTHFTAEEDIDAAKQEAHNLLQNKPHIALAQHSLNTLVGEDLRGLDPSNPPPKQPFLLAIPGPALLHAYIRHLGWMGAYTNLLSLVRWMAAHSDDLASQRKRDRNGEPMMRRCIVALRVFVERGWMGAVVHPPASAGESEDEGESGVESGEQDSGERAVNEAETASLLRDLETPASADVIDELRALVDSVDDWHGWADDEEVQTYCRDQKFEAIAALYNEAAV